MNIPGTRRFTSGETSFEYLYYPGPKPVLFMLHATGFLPWLWHPIARELTDRFTVIAPAFGDHGFPEPEDGGLSWKLLADDLCVMCEKHGIENPSMVGHSMGGTVITLAAGSGLIRPRGMVLIEPIYLPEAFYGKRITVEQHPLASKSINRKNSWNSPDDARDYLRSRSLFSRWDDEMLDLYITRGMIHDENGLTLACHPRREAALFMGGNHYNPWPLLERIECPVLFLEGETSGNRSYIDLRKAASMTPHGSYRMVEGAGHLVPMEKPGEVLRIIAEFLAP